MLVVFGVLFIILGVVWVAFLGKLSLHRYHGKSRLGRWFAFMGGDAFWLHAMTQSRSHSKAR